VRAVGHVRDLADQSAGRIDFLAVSGELLEDGLLLPAESAGGMGIQLVTVRDVGAGG
jgi:hypothetical protein